MTFRADGRIGKVCAIGQTEGGGRRRRIEVGRRTSWPVTVGLGRRLTSHETYAEIAVGPVSNAVT